MRRLLVAALAATALLVSGCVTANVLPDGRILFISATGSKLFDPATGTATVMGGLAGPVVANASAVLQDGSVLVTGGMVDSKPVAATQRWDAGAGAFASAADMTVPRAMHTATTLADGRVLIVGGGEIDTGSGETAEPLTSAELFDPTTGTFTATGSLPSGRMLHTATLLADGRVLIAGGTGSSAASAAIAQLYDPASGTFTPTGALALVRMFHTATLLADGRVLMAGGLGGSQADLAASDSATESLVEPEVFDPRSGLFTVTGDMSVGRAAHTATLLGDGHVLITGGVDQFAVTASDGASKPPSPSGATAELYDPATGTFSATGGMNAERAFHVAAPLPDGNVLIVGGQGELDGSFPTDLLKTAETYDPSSGTFSTLELPKI